MADRYNGPFGNGWTRINTHRGQYYHEPHLAGYFPILLSLFFQSPQQTYPKNFWTKPPMFLHMEFRSKGTMLLRWKGQVYKVLAVRSHGRNVYHLQCPNNQTRKPQTLHFRLEGFLEAADVAFKAMKKPSIFLLDMDNHGKPAVVTEEQIAEL